MNRVLLTAFCFFGGLLMAGAVVFMTRESDSGTRPTHPQRSQSATLTPRQPESPVIAPVSAAPRDPQRVGEDFLVGSGRRASLSATVEGDTPLSQPQEVAVEQRPATSHSAPLPLFTQFREGLPTERRAQIRQALREGSADTIRVVGIDFLRSFPEYRTEYLPTMKEETLSGLLARFTETDWMSWDFSRFALNGGPTPARAFVDLLRSVNPELGQYADQAAKQWSLLFSATKAGNVYEYRVGMGEGRVGLSAANQEIGSALELSEDAAFVAMIERLRARFVSGFVSTHPQDPQRALTLLLSLSRAAVREEHVSALIALFRRFTLEGSPRYRTEVAARLRNPALLTDLTRQSPELRRSVAEFHLMRAIDALDAGEGGTATILVDESVALFPGLRGQEIVAEAIRSSQHTAAAPHAAPSTGEAVRPAAASAPVDTTSAAAESTSQSSLLTLPARPAEKGRVARYLEIGVSYLFTILLVVFIGGGALLLFLYHRSVRSLRPTSPQSTRLDAADSRVKMTAPNEMDFGDDPLDDFDLRRSIAA